MIVLNVLQIGLNLLHSTPLFFLFSGFTSFIFTLCLVPLVIAIARRYHILDLPDGSIKTHQAATPYLGGLAVFSGFLSSVVLWTAVDARICFLLLGCALLMLLGLADDLVNLSPAVKFFGQFMIAFSFIRAGLYFKEAFFSELWAIPLSFFWLLVCMNAINLIDVMDGLATTVALSAAFGYLLFALFNENMATAHILIMFTGALLAFLYYNRPPAKIYLGDAGSLFLGGFLGVIPFLLSWSTHVSWGFLLAPAPLAVALLELSGLMLIRTIKGIPFFKGSRDHFSHYLQGNGWSKNNILILCATFTSMSILLATLGYFDLLSLPLTCWGGTSLVALWICLLWKQNKK